MRQAHVLGHIIVGTQAKSGDDVEIGIARREENDRQRGGERAQLTAKREAAVDLIGESDVDEGEVGQPQPQSGDGFGSTGVRGDLVALLFERIRVIGADGGLVFDDGDAAAHGRPIYRTGDEQGAPSSRLP